jgi:hypothetical protein
MVSPMVPAPAGATTAALQLSQTTRSTPSRRGAPGPARPFGRCCPIPIGVSRLAGVGRDYTRVSAASAMHCIPSQPSAQVWASAGAPRTLVLFICSLSSLRGRPVAGAAGARREFRHQTALTKTRRNSKTLPKIARPPWPPCARPRHRRRVVPPHGATRFRGLAGAWCHRVVPLCVPPSNLLISLVPFLPGSTSPSPRYRGTWPWCHHLVPHPPIRGGTSGIAHVPISETSASSALTNLRQGHLLSAWCRSRRCRRRRHGRRRAHYRRAFSELG